ncbi:MAG: family 43 glycosylhydrolase [Bacteroidaceae bacterium]|nr:family 43 glycosylhydrolase [Bacteroidaceae bacterium]MBQ5462206.1 family 43 glycosylhydrolase [Bacteroidaceae bacterium]
MKKIALTLTVLMMGCTMMAQNPIIRDQFSADPTARVFNGRVYVYPSHDILPPDDYDRKDWFCMADYHVFSSDNLTDWTDHGMIVTQNKVPWVRPNSYSMWAPDCVYRNGKYYFYFPSAPKAGGGFAVGVAIADKPEGPFVPEPEPIKGINGIDPCVLQASDGNAYIFWGNGRCAKLKENMKELADDNPRETVRWGNREMEMVGVSCLQGLPNRQAEGPFAFEYNGNYYLTYPYVREKTEVLGYAMSKNPMGPYEYKGLIMEEQPNGCWTNHHSIINYKGQWYLFYHHNYYSPNDDKRRSACIEKLFFNEDGTIQLVKQTLRGVGVSNAFKEIQIDRYSAISDQGAGIEYLDTLNRFEGWKTVMNGKNAFVQYNQVDFANGAREVVCRAKSKGGANVSIFADGAKIASVKVKAGTAFGDFSGKVKNAAGVKDLKVVLDKGDVEIDYVKFKK